MTAPVPVSALTEALSRTGACACGTSIPQEGVRIGQGVIWSPLRCAPCAVQHLADVEADRVALRQSEEAGRRARQRLARAEVAAALVVPPLYLGSTLDGFELHGSPDDQAVQQTVLRMGRRYLGAWPDVAQGILILRGAPGTGKGHWVWAVAKGLTEAHGALVKVVKCADLVRRLRASWREDDAESEAAALRAFRDADLVVIDEVSRHAFYGQSIHQHLYDVLDHRIEWHRPTILTSNEDDEGLAAILRPALLDRVTKHGGILEFGTASYRARRPSSSGATS